MINKMKEHFINDVDVKELTLEDKRPSTSQVLYEDTSKRGRNTKHFRLQNGNFMAVMYDHPIHKLDSNTGKYVDLSAEVTETETNFETDMDNFKVRLPKAESNEPFVTVEKGGKEISWKFISKHTTRHNNPKAHFSRNRNHDPWNYKNYPHIAYEKADDDIDLEYDVLNDGVKESIILHKNPGCNTFTFLMKFKGLAPVLSENKKTVLLFRDEENIGSEPPEFRIPPAFMTDANEDFCDDIRYALRKTESGTYLDIILENDWLSDPSRTYPVIIDPRVEISRNTSNNLKFTEICSDGSVVPSSYEYTGRTVGVDNAGIIHRIYVGFNLPELADGFKITKAGLVLHQKYYSSNNGSVENYTVAPVTSPNGNTLSVDSFNWTNVQNLLIGNTIDTIQGYARRANTEIEIDLTSTMENWYNSNSPYDGSKCLVIKKANETDPCCNGCCSSNYITLYSLYGDFNEYHPKMYIEYTTTDLYTDHQKFQTFETGRAGTGSINLFSGKMSFAHGDITTEGSRLPLSISHLYRHEYVTGDENYVNKYGNGWRLSIEQSLEIVNDGNIIAKYTNAQGKHHYFVGEANENGEYVDDAGLGLTYKEEYNCHCGCVTTHVLTDDKGNKMRFNSNGKLIQLIDTNGNVNTLAYTNGNLTSIVDSNNHSAQLYYDSCGKLFKIVDNGDQNRAIYYEYNTSGELISITYPSAESAYSSEGTLKSQFIYGNNSRLERVIDYSGMTYTISYDSSGRVNKLSSFGDTLIADNNVTVSDNLSNDSVSFEYRAKSTAIVNDRSMIKTVYKFDANGRELSSYRDMSCAGDSSKIDETTLAKLTGYKSIVDSTEISKSGKYRSLSVSMNSNASNETNLLSNNFFTELNTNSMPSNWNIVGGGRIVSENYIAGKKSICFSTNETNQHISQKVNLSTSQLSGNILVASAWAKASGNASAESEISTAKFRLCLTVHYEGGEKEEYFENFDNGYTGWQYAAIPFVLDNESSPTGITVKLDYSSNTGTCYFTNARLVSVDGTSTTTVYTTSENPLRVDNVFGEEKNIKVISVTKDNVLTTIDYTDDDSNIVRTTLIAKSGRQFTTDYLYDNKHQLIKTQDYRGLVIEYTYNEYGKEITRKTYHVDNPNAYMFSEHTYENGNFVKTESDPRYSLNDEKLKTTYQHDTTRNLLLKETAVNGQEYNYSYDDTSDDLLSLSSTTDNKTNENQFYYTRGYLTRVAHNGFNFSFAFDQLGRSKSVKVGDGTETTTLLTTTYEKDGVNDIAETVYASGEKNKITTDILGNPISSTYTDKFGSTRTITNATYDSTGKVSQMIDNERGICYNYTYDTKGNVIEIVETDKNSGAVLRTNTFVFDVIERLSSKTYGAVNQTYRPIYESDVDGCPYPDNEVVGISLDNKFIDKVTKDELHRAKERTFTISNNTLFRETYGYLTTPFNDKTIETEIISSVTNRVYGTNASSETLNYTYDKAGNLETISRETSLLFKYYYDGLNRLRREDNHTAGKTYVWDYDVGGNILNKKEYAICTDVNLGSCLKIYTYTYKTTGWRDQLVTFDGLNCVYDSMGNPITYLGHALEWTKVRRLAKFDNNTFEYGANGIRYRKNNTVYTLDGNKILRESDGTKTLTYYHGGSGIVGFNYNQTDYYFRKNLQGDVTEIYTSAGLKVASYAYDAWGKVLSVNNYTADNIGNLNPIRYRSYYYDVETGLYYLNSRYYDPEVGRFINADTTDVLENAKYDINGLNLYAYCDNKPVSGRDDEGDMSFWKKLAIAAAVVVVVATVAAVVTVATGGTATAALCVVGSTLLGAAKGAAIGAIVGAATGAVVGGVQGAVEGYQETGTLDGALDSMKNGAMKGAVEGAKDGLITGMITGSISGALNPSFCFVAGTSVLTTLGKKAIEDIKVGDTVPCVDHITGEASEKKVISTSVNKVNRLVELDIDGEIIKCTETHPFQVKGKGWVNAGDLKSNDLVYTKDWNTATVKSVNLIEFDAPVEVFNFEVEDCHTYFVDDLYVLVHNGSCRSKNNLKPDPDAQGAHTTFKRGPDGTIEHYATYKTNPRNPSGFDEVLRYDGVGKPHNNVPTPHIHKGKIVKSANPWEIPNMKG